MNRILPRIERKKMIICGECDEDANDCSCGTSDSVSVSSTGSVRKNVGKLPMHLVPVSAKRAMAKVLQYGLNKYDARNWEKGAPYSTPYASLERHLDDFWDGQDYDEESGLPQVYHILMNAAMLVEYWEYYKELDDRPRKKK